MKKTRTATEHGAKFSTEPSTELSTEPGAKTDEAWMRLALKVAAKAEKRGEVPIGAVLVHQGQVLAIGGNERETLHAVLGHAECLAIHRANRKQQSWRLLETTLYVTLEPCLMCAGAILQARIPRVVFGAADPKAGAVISLYEVLNDKRLNHRCEVTGGVLGQECSAMLSQFFRRKREQKKRERNSQA